MSVYGCKHCDMSRRNSVHHKKMQYGYHEYALFIDPEAEEAAMNLMRGARQTLMDILTGVGRMSEAEASQLIVDAVSEIKKVNFTQLS